MPRYATRIAVVGLVMLVLSFATAARAAHTTASGTCNYSGRPSGAPIMCRTAWVDGQQLQIYLVDQFSGTRPDWWTAADNARASWDAAPGNLAVSWSWTAPSSYVYLKVGSNGVWGLGGTALGVHVKCPVGGATYCTQTSGTAMDIYWSEIFINASNMPVGYSPFRVQWTFAHEMGHSLALAHHDNPELLMWHQPGTVNGPIPNVGPVNHGDIGLTNPICQSPSTTWGVRCIFNWP